MSNPPITSLQNPRIKEAAKLRDHRQRQQQNRFLIDGARELDRAIAAGIQLVEVFVCESLCESAESQRVLASLKVPASRARLGEPEVWNVSPQVLEKICFGQRVEGVVGIARATPRRLHEIALSPTPLVTVVEGIEKPGNVGAVLRCADAAGIDAVLIVGGTDLYNPNTIRASLGTVFSVPTATAEASEALDWLQAQGLKIFAARLDAGIEYSAADFRQPAAIVLGSEARGLSDRWSADDIVPIRLPMRGIADSLNVSATAAVLFYEALRQRNLAGANLTG